MEILGFLQRFYCIIFRMKKTKKDIGMTELHNVDINTVIIIGNDEHWCYLGYFYWTKLD